MESQKPVDSSAKKSSKSSKNSKVAQRVVVKARLNNPDVQTPEFSDPEDNFCVSPGKLPSDRKETDCVLASDRGNMFAQLKTEMIEIEDQLKQTSSIDFDHLADDFL